MRRHEVPYSDRVGSRKPLLRIIVLRWHESQDDARRFPRRSVPLGAIQATVALATSAERRASTEPSPLRPSSLGKWRSPEKNAARENDHAGAPSPSCHSPGPSRFMSRAVQPDTILRWHRAGFRAYWRWKSRGRPGRPRVSRELRELIQRMSKENSLAGAP